MNCKTLLIKQVLPGLVVLAIGFTEQGLNISLPGESLPQPAPADEVLPETLSEDSQSDESSPRVGNLLDWALEWVEGYSSLHAIQNNGYSTEYNAFRAGPGAFWPLTAWNLLFIDSSPYSPGIRGGEIGQRSALKSLSP